MDGAYAATTGRGVLRAPALLSCRHRWPFPSHVLALRAAGKNRGKAGWATRAGGGAVQDSRARDHTQGWLGLRPGRARENKHRAWPREPVARGRAVGKTGARAPVQEGALVGEVQLRLQRRRAGEGLR